MCEHNKHISGLSIGPLFQLDPEDVLFIRVICAGSQLSPSQGACNEHLRKLSKEDDMFHCWWMNGAASLCRFLLLHPSLEGFLSCYSLRVSVNVKVRGHSAGLQCSSFGFTLTPLQISSLLRGVGVCGCTHVCCRHTSSARPYVFSFFY